MDGIEEILNPAASNTINLFDITINFVIGAFLSFILVFTYLRCSNTVSNRENFSKNFIILILSTTFIISIIKSSIALSLGLVGALSIVRFRTAIKEPEEILYFLICIAIGIGLGANQKMITLISFSMITFFIWLKFLLNRNTKSDFKNAQIIVVTNKKKEKHDFSELVKTLEEHTKYLKLIRLDETSFSYEATFEGEFVNYDSLNKLRGYEVFRYKEVELNIINNHNG